MAVVVAVTSDMPPPQIIEELFTYWNLDDADATLEELEDALIVSRSAADRQQQRTRLFEAMTLALIQYARSCTHPPHPPPLPTPPHPRAVRTCRC